MFQSDLQTKIQTLEFSNVPMQVQQDLLFNAKPPNLYEGSDWVPTSYWSKLIQNWRQIQVGATARMINLTNVKKNGEPATFHQAMEDFGINFAIQTIGFKREGDDSLCVIREVFNRPTVEPSTGSAEYRAGDSVTLTNTNFGLGALTNAVNVQFYPYNGYTFDTVDFDITLQITPIERVS